MKKYVYIAVLVFMSLSVSHCALLDDLIGEEPNPPIVEPKDPPEPQPLPAPPPGEKLPPEGDQSWKQMSDCGQLEGLLKSRFIREIEEYLDSIVSICNDPVPMLEKVEVSQREVTFSENKQEEGVDEADLMKTDGDYVYSLVGDSLRIVKVWPLETAAEMSSHFIEGDPLSLFLGNKEVVVFSRISETGFLNGKIKMTFLDVADVESPTVIRESYYQGRMLSERRIDQKIYLTLLSRIERPTLNYDIPWDEIPSCFDVDESYEPSKKLVATFEELKSKNRKIIEEHQFERLLPVVNGSEGLSCQNVYVSQYHGGYNYVHLVEATMGDAVTEDEHLLIVSDGDKVYTSAKSVYVAAPVWGEASTVIHRLGLGEELAYKGSGKVPGYLYSQFAMSEHEGALRLAVTIYGEPAGHWPFLSYPNSTNHLYTLDIEDSMKELGQLTDLAKGESIRSVRFMGKRGFVVTFESVDPLFVIDLADPANPNVVGELKVPGFSSYLHPFGDNQLIGIGRAAVDRDTTGNQGFVDLAEGLKIALYNTDMIGGPEEVASIEIGNFWSYSEVLSDYQAFTLVEGESLLAIPVLFYSGDESAGENVIFEYQGLHLYQVDEANGFELFDVIKAHVDGNKAFSSESWMNSKAHIKRSLYIGDGHKKGIVTLSSQSIGLYDLSEKASEVKKFTW